MVSVACALELAAGECAPCILLLAKGCIVASSQLVLGTGSGASAGVCRDAPACERSGSVALALARVLSKRLGLSGCWLRRWVLIEVLQLTTDQEE